jgi:hypothetical protein
MIGEINDKKTSIRIQNRNQADDKPLRRFLHANGWTRDGSNLRLLELKKLEAWFAASLSMPEPQLASG